MKSTELSLHLKDHKQERENWCPWISETGATSYTNWSHVPSKLTELSIYGCTNYDHINNWHTVEIEWMLMLKKICTCQSPKSTLQAILCMTYLEVFIMQSWNHCYTLYKWQKCQTLSRWQICYQPILFTTVSHNGENPQNISFQTSCIETAFV